MYSDGMLSSTRKNRTARFGILLVLGLALACAIGLWLFAEQKTPALPDKSPAQTVPADPAASAPAPVAEATADTPPAPDVDAPPSVVQGTVKAGDTGGSLLQQWLSPADIQELADACTDVFPLRRLREGRPYSVTLEGDALVRFEYEIDNDQKLIVEKPADSFEARLEDIAHDVVLEYVSGTIESNLFQTVADIGETPALAIALADIFAWEINFIRDLQPGDSFSLVIEKRFREGTFRSYGTMYAAVFVNQGTAYEAFRFKDATGQPHYYTAKGESVKRAFLKAPLAFNRISSNFTNRRLHPVLQVWRAHPAVDYAAPSGTPVKAVGSGVVTFSGWGNGAGNYIALRHGQGFETMYLHLSGFAKGLKKGKSVRQGEVIGFVGSTGQSTGPHLDFRMKKNGVYINPLKTLSPRTEPVSMKDMDAFQAVMAKWRRWLSEKRNPEKTAP